MLDAILTDNDNDNDFIALTHPQWMVMANNET